MNENVKNLQQCLRVFRANADKLVATNYPVEEKFVIRNDLERLVQNEVQYAIRSLEQLQQRYGQ